MSEERSRQVAPTKEDILIMADPQMLHAIAADSVNLEEYNGYVFINFLQSFPNILSENAKSGEPRTERMAKIASRIMLSREQFVKMIPAMAKFAINFRSSMNEQQKEVKKILDSLEGTEND